jgi:putative transposase
MPDHVHMLINVPPKLAVSSVVGYIKGKSAIHVVRRLDQLEMPEIARE